MGVTLICSMVPILLFSYQVQRSQDHADNCKKDDQNPRHHIIFKFQFTVVPETISYINICRNLVYQDICSWRSKQFPVKSIDNLRSISTDQSGCHSINSIDLQLTVGNSVTVQFFFKIRPESPRSDPSYCQASFFLILLLKNLNQQV